MYHCVNEKPGVPQLWDMDLGLDQYVNIAYKTVGSKLAIQVVLQGSSYHVMHDHKSKYDHARLATMY